MDLPRLGVGGEDRLVLLGPLAAHQVLEDAFAEHDPGPEDHALLASGSNQRLRPSSFQPGSGRSGSAGVGRALGGCPTARPRPMVEDHDVHGYWGP